MFALLPVSLAGTCEISFTYYNNETIPENKYETNSFGFRVVSSKDCTDIEVTKDSAKIDIKAGYNEVGEYKVKSDAVEKKINIKAIDDNSKKNVHITFHMATFSVIQAAQQLIKAVKATSKPDDIMVYYNRPTTLVQEQVKKVLGTEKVYTSANVAEMKKTIWSLYNENPNVYITFYCEDIRCQYITTFFVNQGITDDRYQIYLNCDGSRQYNTFYNINDDAKWLEAKTDYEKYLALAKIGTMTDPTDLLYEKHMFFYATHANVKIFPPTMEYLQTDNTKVKETMDKINSETIDPIRDLKKMTDEQQKMYFDMTGVDADYWRKEYFPKKPMMIIGSSAADQGNYFKNLEEWKEYLISLLTFYGADHSVCFKPHPSAKLSDTFRTMMKECNVKIIETQIPGEAIMAALDEVKVGGYFSTIFLSGTPDFIFAANESNVLAFYQPTLKKLNCKFVLSESQLRKDYEDFFEMDVGNESSISNSNSGGTFKSGDIAAASVVPIVVLGIVVAILVFLLIRKSNRGNEKVEAEEP